MEYTPKSQWEYIYQTIPVNQIPWETGQASPDLVRLFREKVMKKGMKVLDVGCGLGTQTRFIARQGAMATGIDISETAIKKAREQMLREGLPAQLDSAQHAGETGVVANFVVGDVCKMPFPNASFECIYDRGCYHHLSTKERNAYAKEVARVLTPHGLLHMLVFVGALTPSEVISRFLPFFEVVGAYEDTVLDRTNNEELPIHIVRFRRA